MIGEASAPLAGVRIVVRAECVAAIYAGRMLGTMGADVLLVEPLGGSRMRRMPPLLPDDHGSNRGVSAVFAYFTAGMECVALDLATPAGRDELRARLAKADVFFNDEPVASRDALGLDEETVARDFPDLVHVSVLPFGAFGPKAGWNGSDLIVQHAGGEGNLLPNGLAIEMFPDRAPLKIGGHFGEMQGGIAAALGALGALWARPECGGQYVDISSQDANLAVGAFAIQRLGDGSIENRVERSFRFGGVIACADGYLEMLTLEQRQWTALVELLGRPDWALDPALDDSVERSRRGPEINRHIRKWASTRNVDDIVAAGQKLGVPLARFKSPAEILEGDQEWHRGLFQKVSVEGECLVDMLVSPFHFDGAPLSLRSGPPALASAMQASEG